MNQTTVDSNKDIKEYSDTDVITFNVTEKTLEVPPQDKSYGNFSTTYLEGMEISTGEAEFDEKTGEIIEADGTTHTVGKEEMERYKADNPKRNLIERIEEETKKLQKSKTKRTSEKASKTKQSNSKLSEGIEK